MWLATCVGAGAIEQWLIDPHECVYEGQVRAKTCQYSNTMVCVNGSSCCEND
jgi:hypothetical protein